MEHSQEIRIYESRAKALAGVLFCAGMVVFAALLQFGYLHATSLTNPAQLWIYQEPGKAIFALTCMLFGGIGIVLFASWLFTARPLLIIDDEGMSYRVPKYARSYMASRVSWRHVESIEAYDGGEWLKGHLMLTITLKERESEGIAHKHHVVWSFSHLLLPMRAGKLVNLIEKHCAVQIQGVRQSQL